jgi:hypothetical protein
MVSYRLNGKDSKGYVVSKRAKKETFRMMLKKFRN